MVGMLPIRRWYRGSIADGRTSPLDLIMIQPTTFCNIQCKYCYLPNRDSKRRFSLDHLSPLFSKLRSSDLLEDEVTVLWHAGEPLALPISYYQEAFERIQATVPEVRVRHSFQTNGILLTDDYAKFFLESQASVGLSLDGPARIHDSMRVTRRGDGTLAKSIGAIEVLRRAGIPFSVICVLTAESLRAPDEIYSFFKDLGVRELGFNVDEAEGGYETSSMNDTLRDRYKSFLKHFYYLTRRDQHPISVREFVQGTNVLYGSLFQSAPATSTENNPFSIINIDVDGNVSTFSPELIGHKAPRYSDFLFGNIDELNFEKVYDNPAFCALDQAVQTGVQRCKQTCGYFSVCGGGAPANKWFENGSFESTETVFCRFKKQYLADALSELIAETASWRSHQVLNLA